MSNQLDLIRERASAKNALHGCSSDPCGSVVCQTARDRDALLSRVEKAEQAVARVRAVCESDAYEVSNEFGDYDAVAVENILDALDGEQA